MGLKAGEAAHISGQGSKGSAFPCTVFSSTTNAQKTKIRKATSKRRQEKQAGWPRLPPLSRGPGRRRAWDPRECSPVNSPTQQQQHQPPEAGVPLAWAMVTDHPGPRGDLQARGRGSSVRRQRSGLRWCWVASAALQVSSVEGGERAAHKGQERFQMSRHWSGFRGGTSSLGKMGVSPGNPMDVALKGVAEHRPSP